MAGFVELEFGDGVVALVELTAVGDSTAFGEDESPVGPVGAGAQVIKRAGKVLHEALAPIGPVLAGIHEHARALPDAPDELEVQFGIRLTSGLKMAIMTGGDVTFTVKAKWALGGSAAAAAPPPAGP